MVDPARKGGIVHAPTSALQPRPHAGAGRFQQLELHRSAGFTLNDNGSRSNAPTADEVADPGLDDVTAAQLAVDGEVKQRAIAHAPSAV
ncbi:hypothetical protein MMMDOFMJ_4135 [Methylobacterium gnaphalii]|nr:hypothetical protein MMMDOFMJ_4135 [Methylobacterium gnaphalii]